MLRKDDLPSAGEGLSWYSDGPDEEALVNRCATLRPPGPQRQGPGFRRLLPRIPGRRRHVALGRLRGLSAPSSSEARRPNDAVHARGACQGLNLVPRAEESEVREISLPKVGASSRANEIEYALTGSEDEPPNYDEVVLIQKGRSVVLFWLDPESAAAGSSAVRRRSRRPRSSSASGRVGTAARRPDVTEAQAAPSDPQASTAVTSVRPGGAVAAN